MTEEQIREYLRSRFWAEEDITPAIIAHMQWRFNKSAELEEAYKSAEENVRWANNLSEM